MSMQTKIRITRACNKLLHEMPFEKITVAMIAEKSGVSKQTFYRYFLDKYDVVNYHYKHNLDKWVSDIDCKNWKEFYVRAFSGSLRDTRREKNAFSVIGANSYTAFLVKYSYEAVERAATMCRGGEPLSREEKLLLSFFSHGIIAVNNAWVNGELDYSVEEIAELSYLAMPESLRDLWWNWGEAPADGGSQRTKTH